MNYDELISSLREHAAKPSRVTLDYRLKGSGDGRTWWDATRKELEDDGYTFTHENYDGTEEFTLSGLPDNVYSFIKEGARLEE